MATAAPTRSRRLTAIVALVVVLLLVAGVAIWSDVEARHYYTYEPGTAPELTTSATCRLDASQGELALPDGTPCARLMVPASRRHAVSGKLLMVDVLVGQTTPIEYLLDKLDLLGAVRKGSQLVPAAEVLGGAPAGQLACEDDEEKVGATTDAPVAALQQLGYQVRTVQHGAQVVLVAPKTPAAAAGVRCDDLITALGGAKVSTATQLVTAVRSHRPGATVPITVERAGAGGKLTTLHLHATLASVPALDGQAAEPHTAFLGVSVGDDTTYRLPFDVSVDVGDIGGPSDGLALTLGLIDALSDGELTGGHVVAATGTISPDGAVGAIGGVAQKAVSVSRAGATLFLVPRANLATAEKHAGPHLKVEGVSSLAQALEDLRAIGGTVPPTRSS